MPTSDRRRSLATAVACPRRIPFWQGRKGIAAFFAPPSDRAVAAAVAAVADEEAIGLEEDLRSSVQSSSASAGTWPLEEGLSARGEGEGEGEAEGEGEGEGSGGGEESFLGSWRLRGGAGSIRLGMSSSPPPPKEERSEGSEGLRGPSVLRRVSAAC